MDATYNIKPTSAPMKFADRVEHEGKRFTFRDRTGHIHGEFEVGSYISPAPENAIGRRSLANNGENDAPRAAESATNPATPAKPSQFQPPWPQ